MQGKKTPLFASHQKYGGKIVEFGGWLLPVQYSGIIEEHAAVRTKAGLFDVSHMGEIWVEGRDALAFLQNLVTNDLAGMKNGQIRYSPMCYEDGGTVDDLLIYRYGETCYLVVVNAANIDKDREWMIKNMAGFEAVLTDKSDETAQLALQGPLSTAILSKLTGEAVADIAFYHFIDDVAVAGKKTMVSRTGYTGEDGYEIYCAPEDVTHLWESIMEAGREEGLLPAGLGCRDTLRFESCLPLYGHELSAGISPLAAGLGRFVKLDKASFIGREALVRQKEAGLPLKVMGVEVTGRGIARAGYPIKADGRVIGTVTTGSPAPTLGKNMALALVDAAYAEIGREIAVEVRGKEIAAVIVAKPFYKRS
ncbi:MAG: glycine cleavage system aminomethyltransferase GcvT [Acholeplasmataceae bacterium]|nr:glycine cleavage system aminomethyltransferase GcvT [Acholeplasmataceae bacterium]